MSLSLPVRFVKGVGETRERAFSRMGVKTVEDLLFFFPRRYEDRRHITPLSALTAGSTVSIVARVVSFEKRPTSRQGLEVSSAIVSDGENVAKVIWFNVRKLESILLPGVWVALYGKVDLRPTLQLTNPEFEVFDESDPESVGRIVPIYSATAGLSSKLIRRVVSSALELYLPEMEDFIPIEIRKKHHFLDLQEAIMELHRPQEREIWLKARNRLAFDELFLLQTGLLLRKKRRSSEQKIFSPLRPGAKFNSFWQSLPFQPTKAQSRCVQEVISDLASDIPMNRLLQGDVGSGKTAVATAALLIAIDGGVQAAFMAPTEILAQQHFFRLKTLCARLDIRVDLLTGALSPSTRKKTIKTIASGETRIVVGTHAIFSEKVSFKELGLVIVDEQHRFGVLQKNALLAKTRSPHVLVMTATPIPRTLTLSIYGDLDVSLLDELPAGRKPITTHCWDFPHAQPRLLKFVRDTARQGRQIYWVCPLIEESEKLDITAAYSRFQNLKEALSELSVALLHGQLSADEKEAVMAAFATGKIDLLVATSVIEVGVDVPNATVMVIEDAAHFGVAQLHQLRGRVGRGDEESHCILLAGKTTPEGAARLNTIRSMSDGFKIAEMDLHQRGPGEVCGVRQHGVTDFRVAHLARDHKLLELARQEASDLIKKDPELHHTRLLSETLMSRLGSTLELAGTA